MTDAAETNKNSVENKSRSVFQIEDSVDESEDDVIQAKFRFTNLSSGKPLYKHFKVKIIDKKFIFGNYRYKLLSLNVDDDAQKRSSLRKMDTRKKPTIKDEDQEILDHEELPPLSSNRVPETNRNTSTNKIRTEEKSFKFMKEKKILPVVI